MSGAADEARDRNGSQRQMRQRPLDVDMARNKMGDGPAQVVVQTAEDCTVSAGLGWAEAEMTGSTSEALVFAGVRRSSSGEESARMVYCSAALPCTRSGTEGVETAAAASEGSN